MFPVKEIVNDFKEKYNSLAKHISHIWKNLELSFQRILPSDIEIIKTNNEIIYFIALFFF